MLQTNANYSMLWNCFGKAKFAYYKNAIIMENKNKEIPILQTFALNVRQYRAKKKVSQEKLAELAGLHRTYIGMIERAEKNITLINADKIAKALDVQVKDLLK